MSRFSLTIRTDNDAFGVDPEVEVTRILEDVAYRLTKFSQREGVLRDINGNAVGHFAFVGDTEEPA